MKLLVKLFCNCEACLIFGELVEGKYEITTHGTSIGKAFAENVDLESSFKAFLGSNKERVCQTLNLNDVMHMSQDKLKAEVTVEIQNQLAKLSNQTRYKVPKTFPWKFVKENHGFKVGELFYMMSPYPVGYPRRNDWTDSDCRLFLISDVSMYEIDSDTVPVEITGFLWNPK